MQLAMVESSMRGRNKSKTVRLRVRRLRNLNITMPATTLLCNVMGILDNSLQTKATTVDTGNQGLCLSHLLKVYSDHPTNSVQVTMQTILQLLVLAQGVLETAVVGVPETAVVGVEATVRAVALTLPRKTTAPGTKTPTLMKTIARRMTR
jgi:hypothetical protein